MTTDNDEDPELEFSPLGGTVSRDDITVELLIYRIVGTNEGWALEVIDREGASTVWDEVFPTDKAALDEFERIVGENGMASFLEEPGETVH